MSGTDVNVKKREREKKRTVHILKRMFLVFKKAVNTVNVTNFNLCNRR